MYALHTSVRERKETVQESRRRFHMLVREHILPHVDMRRVSGWVLGQHWRRASAEQRRRFTSAFTKQLVSLLAKGFFQQNSEIKIRSIFTRGKPSNTSAQVVVEYEDEESLYEGDTFYVTYILYKNKQSKWKIYDVKVSGFSLVLLYRGKYDWQIRQYGLEETIKRLEKKIRKLTAKRK
ncbi:MAG: ABC transporter substrate-binding protein [Patescibacteria group bacterium]|nr:MAG: ABC transporter substrate-binding protein [Patescibacteria group bacterium]